MNLEECFEKRLLRNAPPDRLKSEKAIEMAQRAIQQAKKLMEHEFYEQAILYSYTAMFQGARVLLSEALKSPTGFLKEIQRLAGVQ